MSGLMVIQVYTKPRTCHLVKYQRLLSSCISGCFMLYFTTLRMLYIQVIFALLYFRLEDIRTQTEKTDISKIGEYNTCNLTHTLTTIRFY